MITLETLPQATAQEVFNQVSKHLLTQNAPSVLSNGSCAYRGEGGLKCAAGCLISDDEHDEKFEQRGWGNLVDMGQVPKEHEDLIQELQMVHDSYEPDDYASVLQRVAMKFNLEW